MPELGRCVTPGNIPGGCHLSRDTEAAIREAGFEVESSKRFGFSPGPPIPPIPPIPHILGIARRS